MSVTNLPGIAQLSTEVDQTLSKMIELLSSLSQEQLNTVPFEGSWTAAEVGQHVLLSVIGLPKMLHGPHEDTVGRSPDSKMDSIREVFANYETKLKAPDFIQPEKKNYEKSELIEGLERSKRGMLQAIDVLDLSKTSTAFELPGGDGHLTRFEWLSFAAIHIARHNHQLRQIVDSFKSPNVSTTTR